MIIEIIKSLYQHVDVDAFVTTLHISMHKVMKCRCDTKRYRFWNPFIILMIIEIIKSLYQHVEVDTSTIQFNTTWKLRVVA